MDKAWDAMHRCLSDGTLRPGRHGGGPLELAVLGGGQHYDGEAYIVTHVLADQVPAVAKALDSVNETWLRERYDQIDPEDYQGVLEDEDFEYTWHYLQNVRDFYKRAAARRTFGDLHRRSVGRTGSADRGLRHDDERPPR